MQGELRLFGPLGNTLAVLTWLPDGAILSEGGRQQSAPSIDTLLRQTVGAEIPLTGLFHWLHRMPTVIDGWRADLSQMDHGLLRLQRLQPLPLVDLRLQLEQ